MDTLAAEAARRRTFAIISHPDAGKTTLTEKLLLYGGAIHLAGSVKSRKASRHAVSDWMKMEQERGISITSSVLSFDYRGRALNLLDTPGHADFSEDTYRVLSAVDSAVMLIDHAKGVEDRTLKLFEVCRLRKMPVMTFMNKLDRAGLEPLELLDDVSKRLGGLRCVPINWPIGMGREFAGVVDRATRQVIVFEAAKHGSQVLVSRTAPLEEAEELIGPKRVAALHEELDLLDIANEPFRPETFLSGEVTPVFWGSALSNFGIEPFMQFLVDEAPSPGSRVTETEQVIEPTDPRFSGFVFKIQANMNPKHRDRIAFLRVVSGQFERGVDATIGRSGEVLRLSKPHSFLAQERSIVDDAFPGDIVGLYDPGKLRIGDTLTAGAQVSFKGIPRFAPEHFARLKLKDPLKRKQVTLGLEQLAHEGAILPLYRPELGQQDPYLGAVGVLQFEVLKERLKTEYGVEVVLEGLPFRVARWIGGDPKGLAWMQARRDYPIVEDRHGHPVVLAESQWPLQYAQRENPGLELYEIEPM
ncbi:MAG: hypothetical protein RIT28_1060 [Pseudomonadota bacterium]